MKHLLRIICCSVLLTIAIPSLADLPILDTVVNNIVKARIALDANFSHNNFAIATENGTVELTGTVKNDAEAINLIQLIQSTSGVKDVDTKNLTIIDRKQLAEDVAIIGKIRGLFLKENIFGKRSPSSITINVISTNGAVELTGIAINQTQADLAIKLAKSVKGVKSVDSKINVMK